MHYNGSISLTILTQPIINTLWIFNLSANNISSDMLDFIHDFIISSTSFGGEGKDTAENRKIVELFASPY